MLHLRKRRKKRTMLKKKDFGHGAGKVSRQELKKVKENC